MGERVVRNDEVRGSIPLGSTSILIVSNVVGSSVTGVLDEASFGNSAGLGKAFGSTI